MKLVFIAGILALILTGCSSYQGGTGTEYDTSSGQAWQLRSPGGLDRAKGTNAFGAMPEMEPIGPGSGVAPN